MLQEKMANSEEGQERWLPIKITNGKLSVSNLGNVRRNEYKITQNNRWGEFTRTMPKRSLKAWIEQGYYRICLGNKHKPRMITVHRLVAMEFVFNPDNKPCVNHIDGNTLNNYYKNLEWCTVQENKLHGIHVLKRQHGACGEMSGRAKLKNKDIPLIFNMYKNGKSFKDIGIVFNVCSATIYDIIKRKTWKTVSI